MVQLAKQRELSALGKPKPVFNLTDMRHLMKRLWPWAHRVQHERVRIQDALLILLHAYTASRPGAIMESADYPNECLFYEV